MTGVQIIQGDCREVLKTLPVESVHCVVTSPPYLWLRDYGLPPVVWGGDPLCDHDWETARYYREGGGCERSAEAFRDRVPDNAARLKKARWREDSLCRHCGAWLGQLGLERTLTDYVRHLVEVFREVWRVLRPDGTLWINLGDSYNAYNGGAGPGSKLSQTQSEQRPELPTGYGLQCKELKAKDLLMVPARVALALQADGWYLRQEITWCKPAAMPESVKDRCTRATEKLYMLAKEKRYYYDAEAIAEPCVSDHSSGNGFKREASLSFADENGARGNDTPWLPTDKRNKRDWWVVNPEPSGDAHYAAFPRRLVNPCVLAGCPEGGTVLDPFAGTGTVGVVAAKLGRQAILIEQSADYIRICQKRNAQLGLLI